MANTEAQPAPRVLRLTLLEGLSINVSDINDTDQITGYSETLNQPVILQYEEMTPLNRQVGDYAVAINASGQVAVNGRGTGGQGRAILWSQGILTEAAPLFPPNPPFDLDRSQVVFSVNDAGHMVGSGKAFGAAHPAGPGFNPLLTNHAFVYRNGVSTDLGVLSEPLNFPTSINESTATDINNAGQVVGYSQTSPIRDERAFLYEGGGLVNLGTLGGAESRARAINESGEIVGRADILGGFGRPFIYRNGTMTDLGIPNDGGEAWDINDAGEVVGDSVSNTGPVFSCFIIVDGTTYDLNQLAADYLSNGTEPGFVRLEHADAINNRRQIVGYGNYSDGPGTTPYYRSFWLDLAPEVPQIKVFNTNRHSNPAGGLGGVTVTFINQEQVSVGSAVTDEHGAINVEALHLDLLEFYHIKIEQGDVKRVYEAVRPQQVLDQSVRLILPVSLHERLAVELPKLKGTGTLVLDYDIEQALNLVAQRNQLLPETATAHQEHNQALARLLITAESMSRIYAAVEPLAKDAGKLLVDNLVAFLAIKDASSEAASALAGEVAATTLSSQVQAFAISAILASLKHSTDVAQKALVQGSQALLPPWGAELVNQSSSTIIAGVLGALSSGAWDSQKGKAEGRKKLLENLAKLLGEQVGGRIIASAHVAQTQQDFTLAKVRVSSGQGTGTVASAFVAAQGKAIEVEEKADLALVSSALIDDTATRFGYVADYADAVGKIPAAQMAALMSRMIKVLNLGLVVKAVTDDFSTLADISFEDTPAAVERAFFPAGMGTPTPAAMQSAHAAAGEAPESAALPAGFATALSAFRAAVVSANAGAALTAGENMISLNVTLEEQIEAALLQTRARALSASPADPVLNGAYNQLQDAMVALRAALAELYPAMAGYLAPPIADPDMTTAGLLALIDTAAGALTAFENAETAAQAAGSGITAPALVVTLTHGLINTEQTTRTQPGPASLRARIFNVGDVAAQNVTVELVLEPATGPVPAFSLSSAAVASVGTLSPGQSVDVTWSGIATDVSGSGIGSVAAYTVTIQAGGARAEGAGGGFEVVSKQSTFAEWAAGFSGLGGQNDFTDDPDLVWSAISLVT